MFSQLYLSNLLLLYHFFGLVDRSPLWLQSAKQINLWSLWCAESVNISATHIFYMRWQHAKKSNRWSNEHCTTVIASALIPVLVAVVSKQDAAKCFFVPVYSLTNFTTSWPIWGPLLTVSLEMPSRFLASKPDTVIAKRSRMVPSRYANIFPPKCVTSGTVGWKSYRTTADYLVFHMNCIELAWWRYVVVMTCWHQLLLQWLPRWQSSFPDDLMRGSYLELRSKVGQQFYVAWLQSDWLTLQRFGVRMSCCGACWSIRHLMMSTLMHARAASSFYRRKM